MSLEYGIITNGMTEKELVKAINCRLTEFFAGNQKYDIYKNHKLGKDKTGHASHGKSYREDAIEWDYPFDYGYFNKPFGVYVQLYPNTNEQGAQKFKMEGVTWNLFINAVLHYDDCTEKTPSEIVDFANFILNGIPCETVLIYEYAKLEERF